MKRILVIAAHPDDEVLGMGGSIAKFVAEGNEVHLLIITDGCSSQYRGCNNLKQIIEEKMRETNAAAEILGITSVSYGGLCDMKLDVTPHVEINRIIEETIEKVKPNTVFTHFWGDVNKDHQRVYESTLVAVRPLQGQMVTELYCYSVPSSTEWNIHRENTAFKPTVFIEIEAYKNEKYCAMKTYTTELREYPHPRSVQHLKELDIVVGLQVGLKASESFMLIREIIN